MGKVYLKTGRFSVQNMCFLAFEQGQVNTCNGVEFLGRVGLGFDPLTKRLAAVVACRWVDV